MPLEDISTGDLDAFISRKQAQWAAVAVDLVGMQMVRSGERGSQFVIVGPNGERVIYGQLPHRVVRAVGTGPHRRLEPVEDDRKPVERRRIDLDDAALSALVALWKQGRSAAPTGLYAIV